MSLLYAQGPNNFQFLGKAEHTRAPLAKLRLSSCAEGNARARAASDSRGVLTPHTVPRTLFRYACSASCFASVAKQFPKEADELFLATRARLFRRRSGERPVAI